VVLDVGTHETTDRKHLKTVLAGALERVVDQLTAQPTAFEARVDLCVHELDQAGVAPVVEKAGELAVGMDLVAVILPVVRDRDRDGQAATKSAIWA
jgi:hypothetical protein